jgi:hypothetical protein
MADTSESVSSVLSLALRRYEGVINSTEPASSDVAAQRVEDAIAVFHRLQQSINAQGAFSRNEELDDMSTQSLSMLTVPYYIADLVSRRACGGGDHRRRIEALSIGAEYALKYLRVCETVRLIGEDEIERRLEYRPLDRSTRIEAHRRKKDLTETLSSIDQRIGLERAKAKRLQRILREEDEEEGGRFESDVNEIEISDDLLRERHIAQAKLFVDAAFELIHSNKREADMLGSLTEEEKLQIIADYQKALTESRPNAPNLYFPAARRPELQDVYLDVVSGTRTGPMQQHLSTGSNYEILGCGHNQPLRQRIKEEAFMDRNKPTMTLEEFAEQEMAAMAEQARQQAAAKREHEEEEARLGPDGVEERDRLKAAAWDNWKDDNPANGISSKGNYS